VKQAGKQADEWQPVCQITDLGVERGATALVHGKATAIFRTDEVTVFALNNYDPLAKASVLARGIVGIRDQGPFVVSLSHGRAFDLRTGECLDEPAVRVAVYPVRVVRGVVLVGRGGQGAGRPAPGN
jgi:nitrite reductase (NADH) small subunit